MTTPSEALPFSPSACPPSAAEAGRSPACCPHQFRIVEAMQTPRLSGELISGTPIDSTTS